MRYLFLFFCCASFGMCACGFSICSCLCSCLQTSQKKKLVFSFCCFCRWQPENGTMQNPNTMRRLSSSQGKVGITGPPKGGDRNWNPTGSPGGQAWTPGNSGRSDGQYRRVTDTDDLPPPPGFTPKHRNSSARRVDYGNFNSRGERDTDGRRSRGGSRRHGSQGRTRHYERNTSDRRSKEGHRARSRRNKNRKKRRGSKKKRGSSRTDSRSSYTSMSKRSTYSEKIADVEPEIKHPDLLGMDRAAFEERFNENPDFRRVVHNFIRNRE